MASTTEMCQLQCKSGKVYPVEKEVMKKSKFLRNAFELSRSGSDAVILLDKVTEDSMEKIIGWCEHHKNDEEPADDGPKYDGINEVDEWDKIHLNMPDSLLFELIIAANYLNIPGLIEATTSVVANQIADLKEAQKIRERFNIECDLSADAINKILEDKEEDNNEENEKEDDDDEEDDDDDNDEEKK